jgi:hemerythrin superfamily protein
MGMRIPGSAAAGDTPARRPPAAQGPAGRVRQARREQPVTAEPGPEDVITLLVRDHREVEDFFRELECGAAEPGHRAELVRAATVALVRHSVAEERFLYPAVREHIDAGAVDRALAEHAEAERLMKRLEALRPTDAAFEPLLAQLIGHVREHFAKEEDDLFAALRERCPRDTLSALGDKVRFAERMVSASTPAGTHDPPPSHTAFPAGVGMVDRVRDAMTGRSRR